MHNLIPKSDLFDLTKLIIIKKDPLGSAIVHQNKFTPVWPAFEVWLTQLNMARVLTILEPQAIPNATCIVPSHIFLYSKMLFISV